MVRASGRRMYAAMGVETRQQECEARKESPSFRIKVVDDCPAVTLLYLLRRVEANVRLGLANLDPAFRPVPRFSNPGSSHLKVR